MNKKIFELSKCGMKSSWASDFANQAWTNVTDLTGGYGGWAASTGYMPRINYSDNGIIQWQSTTYWYHGHIINHFQGEDLTKLIPSVFEGNLYGRMATGYHTQSTSYNFFHSGNAYTADETSTYKFIRTTTGLSFSICSHGNYHGSFTQAKAFLNGVELGIIGGIAVTDLTYTIKFKIVGGNLYAALCSGDMRDSDVTLTLIAEGLDTSTLTGKGNTVFMSSWITNDQGQSCYGEVRSLDTKSCY